MHRLIFLDPKVFFLGISRSSKSDRSHGQISKLVHPKKDSLLWRQPIVTYPSVLIPSRVGYPDAYLPDEFISRHQTPSYKMLQEALLTDLISPGFLQVDDITVLSPIRKDEYFKIAKSKGHVLYLAHKTCSWQLQLPFYLGNPPPVIHNGFKIRIKNIQGVITASFARKTVHNPKSDDILEAWLGDQGYPAGRVVKGPMVNKYSILGEGSIQRFIIHKAISATNSLREVNNFRYIIHDSKTMGIVGQISSTKGTKSFFSHFDKHLTILDKTLIVGAMFLISARIASGVEMEEEKIRKRKEEEKEEEMEDSESETEKLAVQIITTKVTRRRLSLSRSRSRGRGKGHEDKRGQSATSATTATGGESDAGHATDGTTEGENDPEHATIGKENDKDHAAEIDPGHVTENGPSHVIENDPAPATENYPAPAQENDPPPAPENYPSHAIENDPDHATENDPSHDTTREDNDPDQATDDTTAGGYDPSQATTVEENIPDRDHETDATVAENDPSHATDGTTVGVNDPTINDQTGTSELIHVGFESDTEVIAPEGVSKGKNVTWFR